MNIKTGFAFRSKASFGVFLSDRSCKRDKL